VRSPYLTLATLAPCANTFVAHLGPFWGVCCRLLPRAAATGCCCGLPQCAHEVHRHAFGESARGDSSGIHRLALAWGHPVAMLPHIERSVLRRRRGIHGPGSVSDWIPARKCVGRERFWHAALPDARHSSTAQGYFRYILRTIFESVLRGLVRYSERSSNGVIHAGGSARGSPGPHPVFFRFVKPQIPCLR